MARWLRRPRWPTATVRSRRSGGVGPAQAHDRCRRRAGAVHGTWRRSKATFAATCVTASTPCKQQGGPSEGGRNAGLRCVLARNTPPSSQPTMPWLRLQAGLNGRMTRSTRASRTTITQLSGGSDARRLWVTALLPTLASKIPGLVTVPTGDVELARETHKLNSSNATNSKFPVSSTQSCVYTCTCTCAWTWTWTWYVCRSSFPLEEKRRV